MTGATIGDKISINLTAYKAVGSDTFKIYIQEVGAGSTLYFKKELTSGTNTFEHTITQYTTLVLRIEKVNTTANNVFVLTDLTASRVSQTIQAYDDRGRITDNNLGTYNYKNTAKTYQNTSITVTPEALTHYQNYPTQNISYNAFKSPYQIEEVGKDKISFTYNDNNSRSAMFYGSQDNNKLLRPLRKYYSADGSMEIKHNIQTGDVEFVTYIGGDGYTAPIVLKSDGTTQNYLYLHRDYQGSILAITDATGAVLEKRLFDAWGAIISVQDGAGNTLNGLTILDRGYTGHEHLQSVGLINMNGRLYDPKLHRFLQPDNNIQDPSNTQNYNRYGYVLNNPLKYTDPSGEFKINWNDVIAGVAIVAGAVLCYYGLAVIGAPLIAAGVGHFVAAASEYSKTGDWNAASNNAGFVVSYSQRVDWLDGGSKTDVNGVTQNAPVVTPKTVEDVKKDKGVQLIQSDGGDRSHICTSGVLYPKPPIFRLPDYVNVNVSYALPFGDGWIGWNTSLSLSRYGNLYASPLGFSVGKSVYDKGSFSVTANWLNQSTVPSAYQMNNFLSGKSFNAGGGYWIGGGETWSPGNGTATGAGIYSPQIGGSYNYTPNAFIFYTNLKW